jgi:hypothetical protein
MSLYPIHKLNAVIYNLASEFELTLHAMKPKPSNLMQPEQILCQIEILGTLYKF